MSRSKPKYFAGGVLGVAQLGMDYYMQKQRQKEQEENMLNIEKDSRLGALTQQMAQLPPPTQYTPTFKYGGRTMQQGGAMDMGQPGQFVDYKQGQSHSGPDGGIPVDESGQPSAMSGRPEVALTEKGEVTFNGYVYSDSLKLPGNKKRTFADEAKRIKNKHKLYLGDKLDRKDFISRNAFERELEELMMVQETIKGNTITQEDAEMMMQQQAEEMMQQQQMQGPEAGMEGGMPMEGGMGAPGGMEMPMGGEQEMPMMFGGGRLVDPNARPAFTGPPPPPDILNSSIPSVAATAPHVNSNSYRGYAFPEGASSANDVKAMQTGLRDRGLYSGNIDGMWGDMSQQAHSRATQLDGIGEPVRAAGIPMSKERAEGMYSDPLSVKDRLGASLESQVPGSTSSAGAADVAGAVGGAGATDFMGGVSMANSIAGIAHGIGQGVMGLVMDKKPRNMRLGRMTPQQISLAQQRAGAREQGRTARNSAFRQMRGASQAGLMAGVQGVSGDVTRAVGDQVGQSHMQEQMANAQFRQQADQTNLQIAGQETMMNRQMEDAWNERRRQYVSSMLGNVSESVTGTMDQDRHSRQYAQWLQSISPDLKWMEEGKGRNRRIFQVARAAHTT